LISLISNAGDAQVVISYLMLHDGEQSRALITIIRQAIFVVCYANPAIVELDY
jgi:hypothetical protein